MAQHVATPGCLDETDISYLPTHQGLSGLYMILISTERNKCTNGYVNRNVLSIFELHDIRSFLATYFVEISCIIINK